MKRFVKSDYVPTFQDTLYTLSVMRRPRRTNDYSSETLVEGPEFDFSEKIPSDILAMICSYLSLRSIKNLSITNKTLFQSKTIIRVYVLIFCQN